MNDRIAAADLLTIDVEAEIRKLGQAPVEEPEQIPAELARRAIRAGARRVEVALAPGAVTVRDDGLSVPQDSMAALAALVDPARPAQDRHAALLALEGSSEAALLTLASAQTLRLDSGPAAGAGLRLDVSPGEPPRLATATGSAGTRIELPGLRLRPAGVRRWLTAICRFARSRIVLDGSELPAGFESALAEAALSPPLTGRIAVPERGEEPHLWLLMHGAVVAHMSLPGRPSFEAAIEMSGRAPEGCAPAALRAAIRPLEPELLRQLGALLGRLGGSLPARPEPEQRRLRLTLLRAIAAGAEPLSSLPVLPGLAGPRATPSWFSVDELAALASAQTLYALFPDQYAGAFRLPPGPIFILDPRERSLLGELCDARFAAPQPRSAPSLGARVRATGERLRAGAQHWLERLPRWGAAALGEDQLTAAERALLISLAGLTGLPPAVYTEAGGPVSVRGGRLWLPRRSPLVRAAVAALARDADNWRYPALLALLGERAADLPLRGDWTPVAALAVLDRPRRSAYPAAGKLRASRNLRGSGRVGTEEKAP